MKKTNISKLYLLFAFVIFSCFILVLSSCTSFTGNNSYKKLLENASPDTSAMEIFYFDGENTTSKTIFDYYEVKKIVDDVNNLKAKLVYSTRVEEMKVPTYGIEINGNDGYFIWLTYSNGLWLLSDGTVYKAKFDFESLYNGLPDKNTETMQSGFFMRNSFILCKYDKRYYLQAEEMSNTKDGVTLSVVSVKDNVVTVKLQNDSDVPFEYGTPFDLQINIDGVWYYVPPNMSNYGFEAKSLGLSPHSEVEDECNLFMYEELTQGHYRITFAQRAAEFHID